MKKNGIEICQSKNHPDNAPILTVDSGDDEEPSENNNSILTDKISKKRSDEKVQFSRMEKTAIINVYINEEGLGILLSQEVGMVLFHCDNVWYEGSNAIPTDIQDIIN